MTREERLRQDEAVDPVLFYSPSDDWGVFSNFSPHAVVMKHPFTGRDCVYDTTEHRYQAMKANNWVDHNFVMKADTPGVSKKRGGPSGITLRGGWGNSYGDLCYYVMLECILAKAQQHDEFMMALQRSRGMHIYEDSPTDDIWGWRFQNDYRGKNLLGLAIMQVRDILL